MTNQLQIPQQDNSKTTNLLAIASLCAGVLAYSSGSIFIRLCEAEISPYGTVFDRVAFGTIAFGFWKGVNTLNNRPTNEKPIEEKLDSRDIWLLLAMATFYLAFQGLWAWSVSQTAIAISTVLASIKPIFTCLLACLLWGQRFDNKFLIGMIIAIAGASAIGFDDLQIGTNKIQGDIAAFMVAILEAAYLLTIEKLRTKIDSITIILWCCGLGTLLSLPIFLFTEDRLFPYSVNGWVFVTALVLIDQVLGQGFLAYSLKKFSSGVVALVLLLEPVLVAIAAWGIFGEKLSLFDWVALFVILLGLYLAISSEPTKINIDQNSTLDLDSRSKKPKQIL